MPHKREVYDAVGEFAGKLPNRSGGRADWRVPVVSVIRDRYRAGESSASLARVDAIRAALGQDAAVACLATVLVSRNGKP